MSKKEESLLGLVPVSSGLGTGGNGNLASFGTGEALIKDEKRTLAEFGKQVLVIEATAAKTLFGMTKIGELHRHGAGVFDETAGNILDIKDRERGTEHGQYVAEFAKVQLQVFARHMIGAIEVGATNIGTEIHRSLYLPEPEQRSLWKKLFG